MQVSFWDAIRERERLRVYSLLRLLSMGARQGYDPAQLIAQYQPGALKLVLLFLISNPVTGGLLALIFFGAGRFHFALDRLRETLLRGHPLSLALRLTFGRLVPGFFVNGLDLAERQGTAATTLPRLVDLLRGYQGTRLYPWDALLVLWVRLLPIMILGNGLIIFIFPKMNRMWTDMRGVPSYGDWMMSLWLLFNTCFHLGGMLIVLYGMFSLLRWHARATRWMEAWVRLVPVLGGDLRRLRMLEWVQLMRTQVQAGMDLPAAADWYLKVADEGWFYRRVERFAAAVKAGTRWDVAWGECRLTLPALQWLVHEAAHREEPLTALTALEEILRTDVAQRRERWVRWTEVASTLICGALTAWFAYSIFHPMILLLEAMTYQDP